MHKISRRSGLICGNAVRQLKTAVTFGLESTLMPAITGSSYLGKNIDETNRRTDRQTDRQAGWWRHNVGRLLTGVRAVHKKFLDTFRGRSNWRRSSSLGHASTTSRRLHKTNHS